MSIAIENHTPDSAPDTLAHIDRVQELLQTAINNLSRRAVNHDLSKLQEPEKSAFDRLKALSLSGMVYGSEEYRACLRAEKPAIQHHYKANSHHPEHVTLFRCAVCRSILRESETWVVNLNDEGKNPRLCSKCCPQSPIYECEAVPYCGPEAMSLFDVLEMLLDWKAATERMKDGGDIRASLIHNTTRFNLSPQLAAILANTIAEMGW